MCNSCGKYYHSGQDFKKKMLTCNTDFFKNCDETNPSLFFKM